MRLNTAESVSSRALVGFCFQSLGATCVSFLAARYVSFSASRDEPGGQLSVLEQRANLRRDAPDGGPEASVARQLGEPIRSPRPVLQS